MGKKPLHESCCFTFLEQMDYCKLNCKYYINEIEPLENDLEVLREAEEILNKSENRIYSNN